MVMQNNKLFHEAVMVFFSILKSYLCKMLFNMIFVQMIFYWTKNKVIVVYNR